jgi:DeoR family glycerol-3-phosphate regulon repressor
MWGKQQVDFTHQSQPKRHRIMNRSIRQHEIFKLVQKQGTCTISELARMLNVSGETIRRNLKGLTAEGLVVRAHGGVSLPIQNQEPPIVNRMQRMVVEKKRIAEAVSGRIEDGDSIIIDTGSTTAYCAQSLLRHSNLTVVTNSSYIANLLASRNGNRVFMAGGELRAHDAAAFGPSVISFVKNFQTDKSVLSIGAIHPDNGCMNYELCEADFSRAVISQSSYVILATDASKFDRNGIARVCDLDQIDLLVTNDHPGPNLTHKLQESRVELMIA